MPVYVENRQIVVPGDPIADKNRFTVEGKVYERNGKYYSKVLGVVFVDRDSRKVNVVTLKGKYIPKPGDVVIGKVVEVGLTNWIVDINSPYPAVLPLTEVYSKPTSIARNELSKILDVGDIIAAKIISFDYARDPLITIKESRLGKVKKGLLVEVSPSKIPRVIGRKGSMISMIKEMLNVDLLVGQNGRIVIIGDDKDRVELAALVIKKIEREAHTSGLTDRVKEFITVKLSQIGGGD